MVVRVDHGKIRHHRADALIVANVSSTSTRPISCALHRSCIRFAQNIAQKSPHLGSTTDEIGGPILKHSEDDQN